MYQGYRPQQPSQGYRPPQQQPQQQPSQGRNRRAAPARPIQPSQPQPQPPPPQYYPAGGWYQPVPQQQWQAGRPAAPAPVKPVHKSGGSSNGRGSGNGKKPRKRSFRGFCMIVLALAVLAVGGYYGIRYMTVRDFVKPYMSVFAPGVSVDGIDLSGMSREDGYAAVRAQALQTQNSWYVRLVAPTGVSKDITSETLGVVYDPTAALDEAWQVAHSTDERQPKTIYALKSEIEQAAANPQAFYSAQPSKDTSPIDTILAALEGAFYEAPQNAALIGFDPDAADPFTFQKEVWGKRLDIASLKQQIFSYVETNQSGEIHLEPTAVEPEIKVSDLRKYVTLRCRAVTPIDKHSTEERNNNIRVAFSKFNGMVMQPDKKFSFNSVVGRRTQKNGFYQAFEYSYGELTTGWGGGVCQASTTVYLAAIQSGLKILDRTSHSTAVTYTDMGKDATVSDTKGREIDFVFRNNTESEIYLTAHVIKDPNNKKRYLCEVCVYGLSLDDMRYELETEVVQKLPPPSEPEIIEDTKHKYTTYPGEQVTVIKASEGYVVDSYLCKLQNNVQVERTKVSTDTYKNRAERIYVGVEN